MSEPETSPAPAANGKSESVAGLRWHQSLRGRLMLWTSLTSAGLLLLVSLGTYGAVRQILLDNARAELDALAAQTAGSVLARLEAVMTESRTLVESVHAVGPDPATLRGLLRAVVTADPDVAGAMLILEPEAQGPGSPGFHWYVRREGEDFHEQPMRHAGYDYAEMSWWATSSGLNLPWWSDPYANVATGQHWFATFNQPVQDADGGFVGLVSLDLPLAPLQAQLSDYRRNGIAAMLLSPNGTFAVHPDPAVELRTTLADLVERHARDDLAPVLEAVGDRKELRVEHRASASEEIFHTKVLPLGGSGWTLIVSTSEATALARLHQTTRSLLAFGALAILVAILLVRVIARRMTTPLMEVADSAGHFAAGEFDWPVPHTARGDEVGTLARAYDHARCSIKTHIAKIGEMTAARQKLESELSIARDIQLAMLPPNTIEAADGFDVHGRLEAAKAVGGDFFTFRMRDDGQLWFVVGDVSDKGIPAALFMARTMTVLEIAAERGGSPSRALALASRQLAERNDACMFATVICGVLEPDTGALSLASAGHDPPLLARADGTREYLPLQTAGPLGIETESAFAVWRGLLRPGDALILYTDGVTEAFDADDRAFGPERLAALPLQGENARSICCEVVEAVHGFAGEAPQSDDITVLAVIYHGRTTSAGPGGGT